jgi:hypothetical protein
MKTILIDCDSLKNDQKSKILGYAYREGVKISPLDSSKGKALILETSSKKDYSELSQALNEFEVFNYISIDNKTKKAKRGTKQLGTFKESDKGDNLYFFEDKTFSIQ